MRGGERTGAGRKVRPDRKNMTLSVSTDTVLQANKLRARGIKVNELVEKVIKEQYTFWIEGRL